MTITVAIVHALSSLMFVILELCFVFNVGCSIKNIVLL